MELMKYLSIIYLYMIVTIKFYYMILGLLRAYDISNHLVIKYKYEEFLKELTQLFLPKNKKNLYLTS